MSTVQCETPFGPVTLHEKAGRISAVTWGGSGDGDPSPLLVTARAQLADYFSGSRRSFDLPLAMGDGAFGDFLRLLMLIPFGETRTYGDLARRLKVPAQAVGQMCGKNRLPILIPCHRVLGTGSLGGFSAPGGIETKVALLRHERAAGLLI
jgi:methylated-DNA-[protein]-cysteine S-methyltransferase